MWRPEEEIKADLASSDPARLAEGIQGLEVRMGTFDEFEIDPSTLLALAPFGERIPPETQLNLLNLLVSYESFSPPLQGDALYQAITELVLRAGSGRLALEGSLEIKAADQPATAVLTTLAYIAQRNLHSDHEIEGAARFVNYLLDGNAEVRSATIQGLAQWPPQPAYQRVIRYSMPGLTTEERAALHL